MLFTLGIALVFVGVLGTLLFSTQILKACEDLKRPSVNLDNTFPSICLRFGLATGFGGIGLIGVALIILGML